MARGAPGLSRFHAAASRLGVWRVLLCMESGGFREYCVGDVGGQRREENEAEGIEGRPDATR
jgi:hypothetical protein